MQEKSEENKKDRSTESTRHEKKTEENEGKTTAEASAATTAAAADVGRVRSHAAALEGTAASEAPEMNEKDERIRAFIHERKTTAKHSKDRIREISKEMKKMHQGKQKAEKARNSKKSGKVQGTKNINSIKSVKKRILIPKVKNKEGEAVKTRQGIANVFAKFYEDLYAGEEE